MMSCRRNASVLSAAVSLLKVQDVPSCVHHDVMAQNKPRPNMSNLNFLLFCFYAWGHEGGLINQGLITQGDGVNSRKVLVEWLTTEMHSTPPRLIVDTQLAGLPVADKQHMCSPAAPCQPTNQPTNHAFLPGKLV